MTDYPKPWRIERTRFRLAGDVDSKSRIVDANGAHVITIGTGVERNIAREENLASEIVDAVNYLDTQRHRGRP